MRYVPRPGVVKTKICGRTVLVPTREASAHCATVQPLPMLWAGTWDAFCAGRTVDDVVAVHRIFNKTATDEELRENILRFCADLTEKGFLEALPDDAAP